MPEPAADLQEVNIDAFLAAMTRNWERIGDADFVALAYRTVLGREADGPGYGAGRRALRAGMLRRQWVFDLLHSEEAHQHLGLRRCEQMRQACRPGLELRVWSRFRRVWFGMRRERTSAVNHGLQPPPSTRTAPQAAGSRPQRKTHQSARVIFTIAARNYLPQVRVLMDSVARHAGDCLAVVVLIDGPPRDPPALGCTQVGPVQVWLPEDLKLPDWGDMTLRYDTLELSTAVKPWALQALLDGGPADCQVVYLDPDIELHAALTPVFQALDEGASVAVTPHVLKPLPGPGRPHDHDILQSGVFNLGFIAVSACPQALSFLAWWGTQLRTQCRVAFDLNLFTDQRWCDLLPCFVERLAVLRDPGMNVAYWNLEQRGTTHAPEGDPGEGGTSGRLRFFHFSGFDPRTPERCSRHQTRLDDAALQPWLPLLQGYARRLLKAGWQPAAGPATPMETLPNGAPLPNLLRVHHRERNPSPAAGGRDTLLSELLVDALTCDPPWGLPRLLHTLYRSQPDLRHSFRLDAAKDASDFADWVRCSAWHQLRLHGLGASAGPLLPPP